MSTIIKIIIITVIFLLGLGVWMVYDTVTDPEKVAAYLEENLDPEATKEYLETLDTQSYFESIGKEVTRFGGTISDAKSNGKVITVTIDIFEELQEEFGTQQTVEIAISNPSEEADTLKTFETGMFMEVSTVLNQDGGTEIIGWGVSSVKEDIMSQLRRGDSL